MTLVRAWRRVALFLVVCLGLGAAFAQTPPLPAAPSDEVRHLASVLQPLGRFRPASGGPSETITFELFDDDGQRLGFVGVGRSDVDGGQRPRLRSQHYTLIVGSETPRAGVTTTLIRAAHAIVDADGGPLPELPVRVTAMPTEGFGVAAAALAALALAAAAWRRFRITLDLRAQHLVQLVTQGSILLYWSVYWPPVRERWPLVALMLVMAFAADAIFSFARFGSWRAGLSVVPVALSINLFEWFDAPGAVLSIVGAFACKHYVRRGPRHIFNPSVAGLTITGLVSLVAPNAVHLGGLFHTLNVPPNMSEWILLAALLPQLRFRILPASLGIFAALTLWDIPGVLRPTILIAMTLLITDPATTPQSDLGKVLFGLLVGALLPVISEVLRGRGYVDDFAKIFAIPVANIAAPWLDVAAAFIARPFAAARDALIARIPADSPLPAALRDGRRWQVPNVLLVACWVALMVPRLAREKPLYFEPEIHWNFATPLVVRDADDVPRCASNPTFCQVFTFRREAALWMHRPRGRAAP